MNRNLFHLLGKKLTDTAASILLPGDDPVFEKSTGMADDRASRLVLLFFLFLILFTFPVLSIFDREGGYKPALFNYLFLAWLLLIVLIAWMVRRKKNP